MNIKLSIIFVSFLTLLVTLPATGAEIKVGTDAWPPFRFIENDRISGFDIDFLNELARRLNATLSVERYPWGRCLAYMASGKIDMMSGVAYRDERAVYIKYAEKPYYSCASVFYVHKGTGSQIKTYEDLYRYEVGYVLSSAYFSPFDTDEKIRKYGVPKEDQLLRMLLNNRLKIIIGTDCQMDYDIAEQGVQGRIEKTVYRPGNAVDLFMGISKKSAWVSKMAEINRVILEMKQDGFIEVLTRKYY